MLIARQERAVDCGGRYIFFWLKRLKAQDILGLKTKNHTQVNQTPSKLISNDLIEVKTRKNESCDHFNTTLNKRSMIECRHKLHTSARY